MNGKIGALASRSRYYASFLNAPLAKIYWNGKRRQNESIRSHLDAAVQWICRAQDAAGDGGVARSYSLVYNPYFRGAGWTASYPETTGYIIPTLFDYAKLENRQDIRERAVRMADWECSVQMQSGAVQGGTVDQPATPAIFNTGQVIFGWLRTFEETGNRKYLDAAARAGAYLLDQQSSDGAWRKNLSQFTSNRLSFHTYNTRTAWALLLLSRASGDEKFRKAAVHNVDFAVRQQLENGWFPSNCLSDPSQPLLHTIAYAIRGIFEAGILLDNASYIRKARTAADAVKRRQHADGGTAGRFDSRWEPTVSWSCLTGLAQIAGIWGRLYQHTGEGSYCEAMKKANAYLQSVQVLDPGNPDVHGGICGSYPVHGAYGRFEILNWAVKFFADALMLELACGPGDRNG